MKKAEKKDSKIVHVSGSRKRAVARATLKPGTGLIRINNQSIDSFGTRFARMKLREPLILAGDLAKGVNISINVFGGGSVSQADAARLAIARALVEYYKDDKLKKTLLDYDRNLLVADIRRKETHKPGRHGKARSKIQKSYR